MTANLTLVTSPARSVVAPRRARSRWSKPWWWLPARYQQHRLSLRKRVEQLEAALIVVGTAVGPPFAGGVA
jgi:hypothetical protein